MSSIENLTSEQDPIYSVKAVENALFAFQEIKFNLDKFPDSGRFNLPKGKNIDNKALIAMCFLYNMGQHNFDDPKQNLDQFIFATESFFNGTNYTEIYKQLLDWRASTKFMFPEFLNNSIKKDSIRDLTNTWIEVLSLSTLYVLNEKQDDIHLLIDESPNAFEALQRVFPET
jgi:hypothetical protein